MGIEGDPETQQPASFRVPMATKGTLPPRAYACTGCGYVEFYIDGYLVTNGAVSASFGKTEQKKHDQTSTEARLTRKTPLAAVGVNLQP
jgi:hypothetical protein